MVTADQLYRLIEQGRHDVQAKRAFFRALPEATMYAHVAKDAAPEEPPRLIKVWHPGRGQYFIPCYTDAEKANARADGIVGVIGLPGRTVLELSHGCAMVVNPDHYAVELYPNEIAALLNGRPLADAGKFAFASDISLAFVPPSIPLDQLAASLILHLITEPAAEAAYAAEMHAGNDPIEVSLLVEIIGPPHAAERLVQTSAHVIQPVVATVPMPIRLTGNQAGNARLATHSSARQLYRRSDWVDPR
jgi:hypothetical protein